MTPPQVILPDHQKNLCLKENFPACLVYQASGQGAVPEGIFEDDGRGRRLGLAFFGRRKSDSKPRPVVPPVFAVTTAVAADKLEAVDLTVDQEVAAVVPETTAPVIATLGLIQAKDDLPTGVEAVIQEETVVLGLDQSIAPETEQITETQPGVLAGLEPEPEPAAEPEPEPAAEPEPEPAAEPEPELAAEPEPELAAEPEPELATEPELLLAAEPEPELAAEPELLLVAEPELVESTPGGDFSKGMAAAVALQTTEDILTPEPETVILSTEAVTVGQSMISPEASLPAEAVIEPVSLVQANPEFQTAVVPPLNNGSFLRPEPPETDWSANYYERVPPKTQTRDRRVWWLAFLAIFFVLAFAVLWSFYNRYQRMQATAQSQAEQAFAVSLVTAVSDMDVAAVAWGTSVAIQEFQAGTATSSYLSTALALEQQALLVPQLPTPTPSPTPNIQPSPTAIQLCLVPEFTSLEIVGEPILQPKPGTIVRPDILKTVATFKVRSTSACIWSQVFLWSVTDNKIIEPIVTYKGEEIDFNTNADGIQMMPGEEIDISLVFDRFNVKNVRGEWVLVVNGLSLFDQPRLELRVNDWLVFPLQDTPTSTPRLPRPTQEPKPTNKPTPTPPEDPTPTPPDR